MLLKGIIERLSDYREAENRQSEEKCGFRPNLSMLFVLRRLQELEQRGGVPLFGYFVDLQKVYITVDRTLL